MELDNLGNLSLQYQLTCRVFTIANTNRDLLGIGYENTATGSSRLAVVYAIQGTFTGFHRVFTEDEKFNKEEPQIFKDEYEGRIVISTGKIATDTNPTDKEWIIEYDKAGITIEDALPKIELSRKKKDKRVFGVLGDKRRSNSRAERLIVNSVGEGGLYIINSNGNIENGDYITSSDYMGYGEKQDDDLLHNYTVAKATIDCNFELDSPYYNCIELNDGIRAAFIAVTYHCG
jgi:large exoprotein involved in heme utilization and adhesion